MPLYRYRCPDGHITEVRASLNQDTITCTHLTNRVPIDQYGFVKPIYCNLIARREAVYREQGVIFSGPGFTRSVLPPARPLPPSTRGESTDVAFEKQDEYAKAAFKDDSNDRPYREEYKRRHKRN